MKSVVLTRIGPPDVLQLRDVPKPTPEEHEVLIRVHATTVTAGDCELRGMKIRLAYQVPIRLYMRFGRSGPTILGQEVSGEIEAVGSAVTRFRVGDSIVGWTGFALGGYAEYVCMRETGPLTAKPSNLTYAEAAPLAVGGLEAAHFMRRAGLRSGEDILIVGAGGSIGTFAVQIAKYLGASVSAVDRAEKLEMLRSIGADRTIDYNQEDYTQTDRRYDVVFDVIGKLRVSKGVRLLRPGGRYLMGNPRTMQRIQARWGSWRAGTRAIPYALRTREETTEGFRFLTELVESRKVVPVIDRTYPLERTADAHTYVESGLKKGNVVITIDRMPE